MIQIRALFAVALHASASGIMGYYIGKAKFSKSPVEERNYIIKGLCLAIAIHGLYDFIAIIEGFRFLIVKKVLKHLFYCLSLEQKDRVLMILNSNKKALLQNKTVSII